ncbi:hypothetical protein WJX81_002465 [Elliptochloris bilobata]|uniref:dual-specificity kinase n=1 Tax=Elliptochloris bilobata TaxID=381761 RepID=A0AAW1RUW9_9CHLO
MGQRSRGPSSKLPRTNQRQGVRHGVAPSVWPQAGENAQTQERGAAQAGGLSVPEAQATGLTPAQALRTWRTQLTALEQSEVAGYAALYFAGRPGCRRAAAAASRATEPTCGWDDERGDYQAAAGDHLAFRYEVIAKIGCGSFGLVLRCHDHKTGGAVAVKIIRSRKRFHQQGLIEVKLLDHLRKQDAEGRWHIVRMHEHFHFRNHLCIVFELLSVNLYELIKGNGFRGFGLATIKRFAVQLLGALLYMAQQRVVHCDLKPENILLVEPNKARIKVIDFGSSCFEDERLYTYIQSRFYRSPEVLLGLPYGPAIDVWSMACILAELLTGFPLFPGEHEQEQMQRIVELRGLPPRAMLEHAPRREVFFGAAGLPLAVPPILEAGQGVGYVQNPAEGMQQGGGGGGGESGRRGVHAGGRSLAQALRCEDALFLDFLESCLQWLPGERATAEQAVQHEWLSGRQIT